MTNLPALYDAFPPLAPVRLVCGATASRASLLEDLIGEVGAVACHGRDADGRARLFVTFGAGLESAVWLYPGEVMPVLDPIASPSTHRR